MSLRTLQLWTAALSLGLVAGCASKPTPERSATASQTVETVVSVGGSNPIIDGKDAPSDVPIYVHLEMWQLRVPAGTISRNDDLWKRMDETVVDVATNDLLQKNGMRVGEAPIGEWEFIKAIIEKHPAIFQKSMFAGAEGQAIELEMNSGVNYQTLFYFDRTNYAIGRSFDKSDYLMNLSFHPTPRKFGSVRVALCPVVRSQKKRLEFTITNEEREVAYTYPEKLYDCNLRVDVPAETFLIVSPTGDATPSSIGNVFLNREAQAERYEQILIIVPRPFKIEAMPQPVADSQRR